MPSRGLDDVAVLFDPARASSSPRGARAPRARTGSRPRRASARRWLVGTASRTSRPAPSTAFSRGRTIQPASRPPAARCRRPGPPGASRRASTARRIAAPRLGACRSRNVSASTTRPAHTAPVPIVLPIRQQELLRRLALGVLHLEDEPEHRVEDRRHRGEHQVAGVVKLLGLGGNGVEHEHISVSVAEMLIAESSVVVL